MKDLLNEQYWQTATSKSIKKDMEDGLDVNARNENGSTALMLASAYNNNPEIIELLIARGSDIHAIDHWGWTPLMVAARKSKNPDIIITLIENGANINTRDDTGYTARSFIQCNEHLKNTEVYKKLKQLSK